ncbi:MULTISPECIES: hypothetical protein [unclassified Microbacterium]|uniref:hypothetical protein n=1 Tax=unclassified Microbacterium TaxID=2609290 RepID=UPI00227673BB|nr:hypothetical protein [Microbacterium sp. SL62]MCY1717874.1 hypothetical protein [Microbacterium sp. SL62]
MAGRETGADPERAVWITGQYGDMFEGDEATLEVFLTVFAELDPTDEEHCALSVTDSGGWNLAVYRDFVVFENLEGDEVGQIADPTDDQVRTIAAEFLAGDFSALAAHAWRA